MLVLKSSLPFASVTEVVYGLWCALCNFGAIGIFAIKKTKGIFNKPVLTGIAKTFTLCTEVFDKRLAIGGAAFLASDDASWISGQTIFASGGGACN